MEREKDHADFAGRFAANLALRRPEPTAKERKKEELAREG